MKRILKYWLPVIFWMGLIFYLSSIPNLKSGFPVIWDTILRKLAHMTEYGILFLLLSRALGNFISKRILFWAILISVIYAFSDEYHQNFVFSRQGCLRDVLIDCLGIFGAYFLKNRKENSQFIHK